MLTNKALFTPTMAQVLERQGYLREAAQIYSHLLAQLPGHTVFREKVTELDRRLAEEAAGEDTLPALFDEWLALEMEYRRLQDLKKLQRIRSPLGGE